MYLVAKPLVLNRCGEPRLFTWTDSMFSVVAGWKEMTQLLHDVYPQPLCEKAAEQFEQAHGLYTLRFLCYARADYAYRLKHYHEYLAPLERGFPYNAMARLIAATPPPVFRTIRFFLTMYRRLVNLPVIGN